MVRMHLKYRKPASGKMGEDGEWKWENVTWVDCWCGMKHSNRVIPDKFWDRVWARSTKPKRTGGILLWRLNGYGEKMFFLVQSYGNLYGVPKGCIEDGETYFEGACREFHEETGTKIDFLQKNCHEVRRVIGDSQMSVFIMRVDDSFTIDTLPKTDVEISSFGFINSKNLKNVKLNRVTKDALSIIERAGNVF